MNITTAEAVKVISENIMTLVGDRGRPSYGNGLLQLLTTPAWINAGTVRLGDVQMINKNDGKAYIVNRKFNPITKKAPILTNEGPEYCNPGVDSVAPLSDDLIVRFRHTSQPITIDDALLRCIEQGRVDYQNHVFTNALINYLNEIEQLIVGIIAKERVGNFKRCDCNDPVVSQKDLPLFRADGQTVSVVGASILRRDYLESQIGQPFVIVGANLYDDWRMAKSITCCNELGFNPQLQQIMESFYIDTNIGIALGGPNKVLAMAPGAVQLATYVRNVGQFALNSELQSRNTIPDPFYGLTHDIVISKNVCADEIKYTMQLSIGFDVFGMPDCWTDDCQYEGMKDVFVYEAVCADTAYCDLAPACGQVLEKAPIDPLCNGYEECEIVCDASYVADCSEYNRHTATLSLTDAVAFQVNGGAAMSLGGSYDLTDSAGSAAFTAKLIEKLGDVYGVVAVSARFSASTTIVNVFTNGTIIKIDIVSAASADVELSMTTDNFIHITDTSTPSNGATISTLGWSVGGTSLGTGAPSDAVTTANFYGTFGEFFAEVSEGGAIIQSLADSSGCTDTANGDSPVCPELFAFTPYAFTDTNDNDVDDLGELALADVYLKVYTDEALTQLVDTKVTNVAGLAAFALATGSYWLTVDTTQGAADGRTLSTTLPKFFMIALDGTPAYGTQWTAGPKVPITPLP